MQIDILSENINYLTSLTRGYARSLRIRSCLLDLDNASKQYFKLKSLYLP